jgi:hypothetical protein
MLRRDVSSFLASEEEGEAALGHDGEKVFFSRTGLLGGALSIKPAFRTNGKRPRGRKQSGRKYMDPPG